MKLIFYFRIILFLLIPFLFIECNSNDFGSSNNKYSLIQPDDSVYFNSLPSKVILGINKTVLIENFNSTFKFDAVLEDNEDNSSVLIELSNGTDANKLIELNTNKDPKYYHLDDEYGYVISLLELNRDNNSYQIVLLFGTIGGMQ